MVANGSFDYTDAFVATLPGGVRERPQLWVGSGLAHVPKPVELAARVLGMAGDAAADDGLAGWRVLESTDDLIHLEYDLPLMEVTVVGRNLRPDQHLLTSGLRFRRKVLGRIAWALIGPWHRFMARRLVAGRPTARDGRPRAASPAGPA